MSLEKKKEIVQHLMKRNILVDVSMLQKINSSNIDKIHDRLFVSMLEVSKENLNDLFEEETPKNEFIQNNAEPKANVKVVWTYNDELKKKEVSSFVKYFNSRYKTLKNILQNRNELSSALSIKRILEKKEKEVVAAIGLVYDKQTTKNGNLILVIEDQSDFLKVIVSKDKQDVFEAAKNIVFDEVIGVTGTASNGVMFCNSIIIPDIPLSKEFKKCKDEVYALVLSDLHVGSKFFLEEDFKKFLDWINGKAGNEKQKDIAKKVKYIFIVGDLIDGIGIYATQQKELTKDDVYAQYEDCAKLLSQIPKDKMMIIVPGNHDAMRITEPQPTLYKDYAKTMWDLPNALHLTNPAYVNIHSSEDFPGFDFLLYHGYSFDYFADNVESIRQKRPNISERVDLVQKFLLQRRHLAPSHSATLYVQDTEKDPLIIEKVPDFFLSGHIHKSAITNYRNVTMISGSCFQSKTPFQEKVGHEPETGRIPLINLQTRETKILRFESSKEEQEQKELPQLVK